MTGPAAPWSEGYSEGWRDGYKDGRQMTFRVMSGFTRVEVEGVEMALDLQPGDVVTIEGDRFTVTHARTVFDAPIDIEEPTP